VRLERDDDAPGVSGASSLEHRRDLRRVVPVVVHDPHARDFALQLEAALGAAELGQPRRERLEGRSELQADRQAARPFCTLWRPGTCRRIVPSDSRRPCGIAPGRSRCCPAVQGDAVATRDASSASIP
jgi:hypothetical protein